MISHGIPENVQLLLNLQIQAICEIMYNYVR
jgi:hypothetical protein